MSPGRSVRYIEEENWLYLRFLQLQAHDVPCSTTILGSMVVARFPHLETSTMDQRKGWIYRWQNRYQVVARRVTHSHTADAQLIGEVRVDFVNYFHSLVIDFSINMGCIVNMDETAVDLSEAITTT